MKLHILFAQRHCHYEGEYAPEALEVCDQFAMDENPDWIRGKRTEALATGEFSAVEIISVDIGREGLDSVHHRLNGVDCVSGSVMPANE